MKKNKLYTLLFLSACVFTFSLGGCKKNTGGGVFSNTLMNRIQGDKQLTLLQAAIGRLHLDTAFAGGGPYSFFAPVDSAFTNAGLTLEKINRMGTDSLMDIIGYHIVIGKVGSGTLPGFLRKKFISLNPRNAMPFIIKNYYGIFIDGVHVDEGNLICADGILHKTGKVCIPPAGNVYEALLRQPRLSWFAAIAKSDFRLGALTMQQLLNVPPDSLYYSSNGSDEDANNRYVKPLFSDVTLLAPTNDALLAAGLTPDSLNYLLNDQSNNGLENLMVNTVLCGHFFSSDFLGGFLINRRFGSQDAANAYPYSDYGSASFGIIGLKITRRTFVGYGVAEPAGNIIQPDISATNGVIHIVDTLLTNY